jgi:hypothetical protein
MIDNLLFRLASFYFHEENFLNAVATNCLCIAKLTDFLSVHSTELVALIGQVAMLDASINHDE